MNQNKLTPKQERFVQGLFAGLSQREAYREAYPSSVNWKDKTVDEKACLQAKNDKVMTRLEALQNEVVEAIKAKNIITVEEILTEYAKIAKADMKNFLEFRTAKTVVDHDRITGEPIIDYAQIINVKDSDDVDGSLISEVSISKDGTFKFKLHNKLDALEKAGKHLGMFIDKKEITGPNGGPIETVNKPDLSKLTIEELKQLAELTRKAAESS